MTRKLLLIVTLVAALAVAGSGIAESGEAASEDVEVQFDSSFAPKRLPRERSVLIALSLWGRITAPERSHPPAMSQLSVDAEGMEFKNGNRPPCHLPGRGSRLDVAGVRKACRSAILGRGRIEVEVAFPDQRPVSVRSELLVLNGATDSGVAAFVFGYLPAPVTGQVLIPMRVRKPAMDRHGIHVAAAVPKIANGYGSTTYLRIDFKRGVFQARCPHGTLSMSVSGTFPKSNFATATLLRNRC
jgi:hypothetical protein